MGFRFVANTRQKLFVCRCRLGCRVLESKNNFESSSSCLAKKGDITNDITICDWDGLGYLNICSNCTPVKMEAFIHKPSTFNAFYFCHVTFNHQGER